MKKAVSQLAALVKGREPRPAPAVPGSLPRLPRGPRGSSRSPSPPAPPAVRPRARAARRTLTVLGSSFVLLGQPLPCRADAPRRPHEVPRAPSVSAFCGFHDEACAESSRRAAACPRRRLPAPSLRATAVWTLCPPALGPPSQDLTRAIHCLEGHSPDWSPLLGFACRLPLRTLPRPLG